MPELTQEIVRELLDYNPETGVFTWRPRDRKWFNTDRIWNSWNAKLAGKPAGTPHRSGYIWIGLNGKLLAAHRLAFLWMAGAWPTRQVDHRDRDRANNRWTNLRDATLNFPQE